jgi:Tripartite tricarboxylate transporter TctB family
LASDPASRNGSAPRPTTQTTQRVVVVGYIVAIGMPPLGFIIGLVLALAPRVRSRHWWGIVLVSVIGVLIWIVVVDSGTLNSTNQSY